MSETNTNLAVKSGYWNTPATWSLGRVPNGTDYVTIPEGLSVILDAAQAVCISVKIDGELIVPKATVAICRTAAFGINSNRSSIAVGDGGISITGNVNQLGIH